MSIAEKLQTIAENEQRVFDAGKQAEYDALCDNVQQNGNRTDYRYFFFQTMFTHIDPKYPIRASNSDSMFGNAVNIETVNWEKFDLTNTSSLYNAFGYCRKLQSIDTDLAVSVNMATVLNSIFRNCNALVRVKKIMAFPEAVWKNSFDECYELVDIIFVGTIGSNGLDMHWSTKLSKASITSIISALSTTTSGLTVTLSTAAVNKAFETSEGANDGIESAEWKALKETKSNWNIGYA